MAKLVWDEPNERVYESGLDRGVLHFPDGGGVVWNGLTSVEDQTANVVTPVHFDGIKINDLVAIGDFAAVMRAYTYPEAFLEYEGIIADQPGVFMTGQMPKTFHLSYRTWVGDGVAGIDRGYKIHILYNVMANPSAKTYASLTSDPTLIEFEWNLSAIPEEIEGFRPSAHIIIDSRKIDRWLLEDIEDILHGDANDAPRLPSLKAFTGYIRNWARLIIVDNNDGTWTATSAREGFIVMLDETTFQLNNVDATYLDADTYEISSTAKNEEDIWLP